MAVIGAIALNPPGPGARPTDGLRPTVEQVGALIASRGDRRPGAAQFNTTTRPTYDQAATLISLVAGTVDSALGEGAPRSASVAAQATLVIALNAAKTIEQSFYPDAPDNAAGLLWVQYTAALTGLTTALAEQNRGEQEKLLGTIAIRRDWRSRPRDVAWPYTGGW
jgi:hypothetical protein